MKCPFGIYEGWDKMPNQKIRKSFKVKKMTKTPTIRRIGMPPEHEILGKFEIVATNSGTYLVVFKDHVVACGGMVDYEKIFNFAIKVLGGRTDGLGVSKYEKMQ